MDNEFFVDTNILVYAFDESEKQKRAIAKKIVEETIQGSNKAFISNQVLAELFVALTQKIQNPVEKEKAQIIVNGFIDSIHWKKINYNANTVSKAMETSSKEKMHFWDAVVIETMLENKVYTILTENTKHFNLKCIKAINPFKN